MKNIKIYLLLILLSTNIFSVEFFSNQAKVMPASDSYNNAGRINQTVKFLADQLSQNKDFENISDSKIAITSFVNVENLKETNKLGNLISEHLIHDMQIRGYRVIDYKMMPDIEIGSRGDYAFSRQVQNLKQDISLNYILTGTYTYYADGVSLNARIVDVQTNVVTSTAQAFIPKADLQYITDTMDPFGDMMSNNQNQNTPNGYNDSSNMGIISPTYIVPGTEGTRVQIKKATF